jgi:radical SAM protein with 4Fe4S-binding SPASM domain
VSSGGRPVETRRPAKENYDSGIYHAPGRGRGVRSVRDRRLRAAGGRSAYKLGNIRTDDLGRMVDASVQSGFGPHKETTLPAYCRQCDVLEACWGGCPKHRFAVTPDGEPGLHYLCAGYKKFFRHILKYQHPMTQLLGAGLPVSLVMEAIDKPLLVRVDGAEPSGR